MCTITNLTLSQHETNLFPANHFLLLDKINMHMLKYITCPKDNVGNTKKNVYQYL